MQAAKKQSAQKWSTGSAAVVQEYRNTEIQLQNLNLSMFLQPMGAHAAALMKVIYVFGCDKSGIFWSFLAFSGTLTCAY
jgi:hypothetical protein